MKKKPQKKKSLLRRVEDKLPRRYKTLALMNTAILVVLSLGVLTLAIQNMGLRAEIKQMARDQRNMGITVGLLEQRVNQLQARLDGLETQVRRQMELIGEIKHTYEIVHYRRPDLSFERAWWKAQKITYGAWKYEIPVNYVIANAWAESDFTWDARGPCGEKSMVQVMYSTFRGMRPDGDWDDLEQVFDAGLHYLRVCYQRQQQRAPDDPYVTFAYYNAGSSWTPQVAKNRAWRHMRRVQTVFRGLEKLGVRLHSGFCG